MLSPKQYIIQKSNQLPLDGCYINTDWEAHQMASIFIYRKHSNGNHTFCNYLVDLKCLGVKDTFFNFNEPSDKSEITRYKKHVEVDYNLVHNIIYAGYEYALEFDIAPHSDFDITKHFLLPDDENVPLIEIQVGDENGNPVFMPYKNAPYLDIVKKLEKNPGKGNYTLLLMPDKYFGDDSDFEMEKDEEFDEQGEATAGLKSIFEKMNIDTQHMTSDEAFTHYKEIFAVIKKGFSENINNQNTNITDQEKHYELVQITEAMGSLFVENYNNQFGNNRQMTLIDLIN